jgi:hypothetical protein
MIKNLTEEQNKVVINLIDEFSKLNHQPVSGTPLFDINEIMGVVNEARRQKEEIRLHNEAQIVILKEWATRDMEKIKRDLSQLGEFRLELTQIASCVTLHVHNNRGERLLEFLYWGQSGKSFQLADNSYYTKIVSFSLKEQVTDVRGKTIEEIFTHPRMKAELVKIVQQVNI